ncbi:transglutaminase family protein [Aurantiacibacter xanthus]|uniref:Transglutaminase family protein n=1 Tax=Aurantiacibacter xanthus TaxID=1784712 RepID=A0A3A1PEQ6_9SPHN|nr:transglutaminase family protein [Aurantiacibacter xanthus]RIV91431.1 transglutaminase family protein [Aurantiacibacter xanthus]
MIYEVSHRTTISYGVPVSQARFNIRLRPYGWPGQAIIAQKLEFGPQPDEWRDEVGPYCVNRSVIGYSGRLSELVIESRFTVDIDKRPPADDGPMLRQLRQEALGTRDLSVLSPAPYLFASRIADANSAIGDWAGDLMSSEQPIVTAASAVMNAIHRDFAYRPGATSSATPPAEAFARREGVCQDFAHVMIVALRSQGIPAAYVSGYLRTEPPPGQERLVGADAMHAWVAVWCGAQLGWIGFDPTNDCLALGNHILIAMGRDYADVSPIDGTFVGSAPQNMATAVDVIAQD